MSQSNKSQIIGLLHKIYDASNAGKFSPEYCRKKCKGYCCEFNRELDDGLPSLVPYEEDFLKDRFRGETEVCTYSEDGLSFTCNDREDTSKCVVKPLICILYPYYPVHISLDESRCVTRLENGGCHAYCPLVRPPTEIQELIDQLFSFYNVRLHYIKCFLSQYVDGLFDIVRDSWYIEKHQLESVLKFLDLLGLSMSEHTINRLVEASMDENLSKEEWEDMTNQKAEGESQK